MLKTILALIGLAVLIPVALATIGIAYLLIADTIERREQRINNNNNSNGNI